MAEEYTNLSTGNLLVVATSALIFTSWGIRTHLASTGNTWQGLGIQYMLILTAVICLGTGLLGRRHPKQSQP